MSREIYLQVNRYTAAPLYLSESEVVIYRGVFLYAPSIFCDWSLGKGHFIYLR